MTLRGAVNPSGNATSRDALDHALHEYFSAEAASLYWQVTEQGRVRTRMVELGDRVGDLVPGLLPNRKERKDDGARPAAAQRGWEIDHAIFLHHVLTDRHCGLHLLDSMRRPKASAEQAAAEFAVSGRASSGSVTMARRGGISSISMNDGQHLNAEDIEQLRALEYLTDLALLDPATTVVLLRGGVMTHHKYRGRRVFCAGINLTKLAAGSIPLVEYLIEREAGYLAKILHGLSSDDDSRRQSKPWVAAVEGFAIGGGAQVVLVCDRVVAEEGAFASLPAAQEGIIPGAANMRLINQVGARAAREMVLTGRVITAGEPDAHLMFDRVVPSQNMDRAVAEECEAMAEPAVQANRQMLNLALEAPDDLRRYLAEFCLLQAMRARSADVLGKASAFGAAAVVAAEAPARGHVHVHRTPDGVVSSESGDDAPPFPPFPPAPPPIEGGQRWSSRQDP